MVLLAPLAVRWLLRARRCAVDERLEGAGDLVRGAHDAREVGRGRAAARPGTVATHSEPQTSPRQAIGAAAWVSLPSEAARLAEDDVDAVAGPKQYGVRRSSSVTSAGKRVDGVDLVGRPRLARRARARRR